LGRAGGREGGRKAKCVCNVGRKRRCPACQLIRFVSTKKEFEEGKMVREIEIETEERARQTTKKEACKNYHDFCLFATRCCPNY
jgi:hypothetical protein